MYIQRLQIWIKNELLEFILPIKNPLLTNDYFCSKMHQQIIKTNGSASNCGKPFLTPSVQQIEKRIPSGFASCPTTCTNFSNFTY